MIRKLTTMSQTVTNLSEIIYHIEVSVREEDIKVEHT